MTDDITADPSVCVARTIYNRPCDVPVDPGGDVCEAHAIAREENRNWWEWDDRDAAEDFRLQELIEFRNELLDVSAPVDAGQSPVLRLTDGAYTVLSGSRQGRYSVTIDSQADGTAVYQCQCRGWMVNRRCSHVDQVIDFIGPDALSEWLPEWAKARGQCSAITARGTKCRNTAMDGAAYCYIHMPRVEPSPEPEPEGADPFVESEPLTVPTAQTTARRKSRIAAAWLALLVGFVGAHQFYLGNSGRGAVMLVLFFIFWPATLIWGLVNAIGLFTMSKEAFDDRYTR